METAASISARLTNDAYPHGMKLRCMLGSAVEVIDPEGEGKMGNTGNRGRVGVTFSGNMDRVRFHRLFLNTFESRADPSARRISCSRSRIFVSRLAIRFSRSGRVKSHGSPPRERHGPQAGFAPSSGGSLQRQPLRK